MREQNNVNFFHGIKIHDIYAQKKNKNTIKGQGSASNRNEYQVSSWEGKGRPARRADNLTTICEPII
jgi:hypothetical protein